MEGLDSTNEITLEQWCEYIADWRTRKGFDTNWDNMMEKLMLVVTELSEAAEAYRLNDREEFNMEIADTFIRLFDICGSLGINIEHEIAEKMKINEGRPHKHGKVC